MLPHFTIFEPARRALAALLTPRPTAFHSPASIRRFPPGTRRKHLPPVFGRKKRAQLFSQAPVGSSSFLRQDTKIPPVVSFGRYFV